MAKRLPYFQFEPAEWQSGNITFCSMAAQGLFINIASLYWQKECELTKSQVLKRYNEPDLFNELESEKVLRIDGDVLSILFLDTQFNSIMNNKMLLSEAGKKGAQVKKQAKLEATLKPPLQPPYKPPLSNKIREDKIIKENKYIEFWDTYSKKVDTVKCKTAFMKLSLEDIDKLIIGAKAYVRKTPELKYRKNPLTWLNGRCWEDEETNIVSASGVKTKSNQLQPKYDD